MFREACARLKGAGIVGSCFIDPEEPQLAAAAAAGADYVELHTGTYSNAAGEARAAELERLKLAAEFAASTMPGLKPAWRKESSAV